MSIKQWLMLASLGLWIGVLVLAFQWTIHFDYDPAYWEDYYFHSQWNIPESTRGIGDEGVYRYIGYRLVSGMNPFDLDFWVPPFGKYLIGLGAHMGNPYLTSWVLYGLNVTLFASIVWRLVQGFYTRWLGLFLFSLNPLLVVTLGQTMLDLPQLLVLLVFLLGVVGYINAYNWRWLFLAGLGLGLFAGIKPGLFAPLFWLSAVYVLWQVGRLRDIWILLMSPVFGYGVSYFMYFWQHQNPIPWIRLHEKMVAFHRASGGQSDDPLNVLQVMATGRYRGFWEGAGWLRVTEWSLLLPTVLLGTFWRLVDWGRKGTTLPLIDRWLCLMIIGYVGMNMMIDFYPRYLLLLLPMSVLLLVRLLSKYWWALLLLLISYLGFLVGILYPLPIDSITRVGNLMQVAAYKELYQIVAEPDISMQEWSDMKQAELDQGLVTGMDVSIYSADWNWKLRDVPVVYMVRVESLYGDQDILVSATFDRVWNQWRLEDLKPLSVEKQRQPSGRHIWLVPHHVSNWNQEVEYLSEVTDIPESRVWELVRAHVPDWYGVYVGPVSDALPDSEWQRLLGDSKYVVKEWE